MPARIDFRHALDIFERHPLADAEFDLFTGDRDNGLQVPEDQTTSADKVMEPQCSARFLCSWTTSARATTSTKETKKSKATDDQKVSKTHINHAKGTCLSLVIFANNTEWGFSLTSLHTNPGPKSAKIWPHAPAHLCDEFDGRILCAVEIVASDVARRCQGVTL